MKNFIETPFTAIEDVEAYTENGVTTVSVRLDFEALLVSSYETALDLMDAAIVGPNVDFYLTDIGYELVGVQDGDALVQVTGVIESVY